MTQGANHGCHAVSDVPRACLACSQPTSRQGTWGGGHSRPACHFSTFLAFLRMSHFFLLGRRHRSSMLGIHS